MWLLPHGPFVRGSHRAVCRPPNRLSPTLAARLPRIITRKSHFTAHLHLILSLGSLSQLVIGQDIRIKQATEQEVPRIWKAAARKEIPPLWKNPHFANVYLENPKVWIPGAEMHDLLGGNCCQIHDEGFFFFNLVLKTYPLVIKSQKNKIRMKTGKSASEKWKISSISLCIDTPSEAVISEPKCLSQPFKKLMNIQIPGPRCCMFWLSRPGVALGVGVAMLSE